MNDIVDVTAIRQLNDELRQTLRGGIVTMTPGVMALGELRQLEVLTALSSSTASMLTTTLTASTTLARWMLAASGSFGKSTTSTGRSPTTRLTPPTQRSPRAS